MTQLFDIKMPMFLPHFLKEKIVLWQCGGNQNDSKQIISKPIQYV